MSRIEFQNFLANMQENNQIKYLIDEPLSMHTSFRIGGPADYFILPLSEESLINTVNAAQSAGIKYAVLGNGTNILCSDKGYRGAAIFTTGMNAIRTDGCRVYAECGVSVTSLAAAVQKIGLSGLEFSYGIPGSVGGAVYMNAGAYNHCISEVLIESRYFDPQSGKIITLDAAGHDYSYRHSSYSGSSLIIISAVFSLKQDDPSAIKERMDNYMCARKTKQPLEFPSAGSVFKRHEGYFTAKLIDEAGLKGYRIGDAQVSEKHAGFIINTGSAKASDVLALIDLIKTKIKEKNGIDIECEIINFGD